jgi:hypothetical protein
MDEKMIARFAAAFTLWEQRYRENPERYMDAVMVAARKPGDLGETRALYFAKLLDEVTA